MSQDSVISDLDDVIQSQYPETEEKEKDIAITRLRIKTNLRNKLIGSPTDFSGIVYNYLENRYGREPDAEDAIKTRVTFGVLESRTIGPNLYYYVRCDVLKRKVLVSKRRDRTSGEIIFVYWGTCSKDIAIYCFVRSTLTSAWSMLERDYDFPSLFAKNFLDPSRVSTIQMYSLVGADTGSQTKNFTKDNHDIFQPSLVTERCAEVEMIRTYFSDSEHAKKLTNIIQFENTEKKLRLCNEGKLNFL